MITTVVERLGVRVAGLVLCICCLWGSAGDQLMAQQGLDSLAQEFQPPFFPPHFSCEWYSDNSGTNCGAVELFLADSITIPGYPGCAATAYGYRRRCYIPIPGSNEVLIEDQIQIMGLSIERHDDPNDPDNRVRNCTQLIDDYNAAVAVGGSAQNDFCMKLYDKAFHGIARKRVDSFAAHYNGQPVPVDIRCNPIIHRFRSVVGTCMTAVIRPWNPNDVVHPNLRGTIGGKVIDYYPCLGSTCCDHILTVCFNPVTGVVQEEDIRRPNPSISACSTAVLPNNLPPFGTEDQITDCTSGCTDGGQDRLIYTVPQKAVPKQPDLGERVIKSVRKKSIRQNNK